MKELSFIKKEAKLKIENNEDLWCLSQIIDVGDLVRGKTLRKIKIGKEGDRKQAIVKKAVYLTIQVEKIAFRKTNPALRVSGPVVEGTKDVQRGEHHSFSLEFGTFFTLIKEQWLSYQRAKLTEATVQRASSVLICVLDRDEAHFALLKKYGYDFLRHITGKVRSKRVSETVSGPFYGEVIATLQEYVERYKLVTIVLASPAFWKEDLMKEVSDDGLKKRIILATCNAVGKSGVNEVLKRPEVKQALQQDRVAKEMNLVELLLQEISKENMAVYGFEEASQAVNGGAVKDLLVTDNFIYKLREEERYVELDALFKTTESTKGTIHIISSNHDGGKKLDGLGGIGGLLRFKLNY